MLHAGADAGNDKRAPRATALPASPARNQPSAVTSVEITSRCAGRIFADKVVAGICKVARVKA